MENETKQITEEEQSWFKSRLSIFIICAVVIAVAAVGVYIMVSNQGDSPEKVAEKYVAAMSEGSSDMLMEITDVKGTYAWEKCDKDTNKFLEEYKKISDEDVNS